MPYHTVIFIYYAIKFIEAQGVKIQDSYHLKEALANKDMRFAELKKQVIIFKEITSIHDLKKIFLHPKWIDTQLYLSLIIKN